MQYSIQTKKYEGPMDLLFDLVNKNKIDISDISIIDITDQYTAYIENMDKIDLELASDFISMAAKLTEIKSRYILYLKQDDKKQEDPRSELVQKIEEYKIFRNITEELKNNISEYDNKFYRNTQESINQDADLSDITVDEIEKIIKKLFSDKKIDIKEAENLLNKNEKLGKIVRNKPITVESKIEMIRTLILENEKINFKNIMNNGEKKDIVASFLAILEMIKLKEIYIKQESFYDDITIEKNKNIKKQSSELIDIDSESDDKLEKKALRKIENKKKKLVNNESGVENEKK
ncbi:segregation and condensation protein A [Peptostreptococcus faecalis]|uniref:segregation and condensation protein A n=1 Tax=Peptostreptococcus faecalis TaxID=2045015 RepID=UPI000C7959AC|nr:segregation/condensation protein A [Peptostreptococcus faecalis]